MPSTKTSNSVQKTTLKNGLRILTLPQKGTRAATVFVFVGTGSKYETRKINGISHFLEHMLFKGTTKRPTALEVSEVIEEVGGLNNAFTSEDWTGYFAKMDASHVNLALDWVADIFANSLFRPQDMEIEKGVVIEEINMDRDNPRRHVHELWAKLLYGDQPAGWSIAGTKETVSGLTRQDVIRYIQDQYVSSNTVVCVAGNINEEKVISSIEALFKGVRDGQAKKKKPVAESQEKPGLLVEFKKTDQTHILLGGRAYNLFDDRHYAAEVLASVLGGGMSSRLFIKLRDKLGLAYYVSTFDEENPDTGFLATAAGVKNSRVQEALKAILKEYRDVASNGVTKEELKKAKDQIKGRMALRLEASEERAEFYGLQELLENRIVTPEEIFATIDQVSLEQVREAAKEIFASRSLNLVVRGPHRSEASFRKILETL